MKLGISLLLASLIPAQMLFAGVQKPVFETPKMDIPHDYLTSPDTKSVEYACPVNDPIPQATSKAAAIQAIQISCEKAIIQALQQRPETRNVISIKMIFPDLVFKDGIATGTIFFSATFFKNLAMGK